MSNKIMKAFESIELSKFFSSKDDVPAHGDERYRNPKQEPKASSEDAEEVIDETEIYKRAKERILKAQQKQVAYGIDKYPEPLNADSWDIIETIDHIMDESVDRLHYMEMLKIKMERATEEHDLLMKGSGVGQDWDGEAWHVGNGHKGCNLSFDELHEVGYKAIPKIDFVNEDVKFDIDGDSVVSHLGRQIVAHEDGSVSVDGKRIENLEDAEIALSTLIRVMVGK